MANVHAIVVNTSIGSVKVKQVGESLQPASDLSRLTLKNTQFTNLGYTGSLLVTDTTTSPTGTWEKSTDGSSWGSYNSTDRANDTTYIRYTPASIADNVVARPLLTLA